MGSWGIRNTPSNHFWSRRKLGRLRQFYGIAVVTVVTILGTLWYWIIEGFSLVNGLYQSVITLSTVGFGEVEPLDTSGKLFSSGFIVVGVAAVVYALGGFAGMIIESSIDRIDSRRKGRSLDRLNNHVLICGYGRTGTEVARLVPAEQPVGVIDLDPAIAATAAADGYVPIVGDCTLDETLIEAGIGRAKRLIVCLSNDGDAISTVLSARSLSPDLRIVSRINSGATRRKLKMAGADHVVSPVEMGAQRLVADTFDPSIGAFLDAALHDPGFSVSMRGAACVRPLKHAEVVEIEEKSGARVVGIHTPSGAISARHAVEPGHLLIAAGHDDELEEFARLVTEH